jgi:hypothetical protein
MCVWHCGPTDPPIVRLCVSVTGLGARVTVRVVCVSGSMHLWVAWKYLYLSLENVYAQMSQLSHID